jgi:hypothetical protein
MPEFIEKENFNVVLWRNEQFMAQSSHQVPTKYPPTTHQVTPQVGELVKVLDGETSRLDIQQALNLVDKVSFRLTYLQPAIEQGFVAMKLNDFK